MGLEETVSEFSHSRSGAWWYLWSEIFLWKWLYLMSVSKKEMSLIFIMFHAIFNLNNGKSETTSRADWFLKTPRSLCSSCSQGWCSSHVIITYSEIQGCVLYSVNTECNFSSIFIHHMSFKCSEWCRSRETTKKKQLELSSGLEKHQCYSFVRLNIFKHFQGGSGQQCHSLPSTPSTA